jgi:general secretion pathway protein F
MPTFRYQALTEFGELVNGQIVAANAAEVAHRIDYLRLVPIDIVRDAGSRRALLQSLSWSRRVRAEEITTFTFDLALLLRAGARLDDALGFLASDIDIGRMRSTASGLRSAIHAGESFADALAHYPELFPEIYVALVRVGETSGTLENILNVLAHERTRADALRRKLADALRYPAFLLLASVGVLIFFLTVVLPQFGALLRDFGAKLDPMAAFFMQLSEFVVTNRDLVAGSSLAVIATGILLGRRPALRRKAIDWLVRLPFVRTIVGYHRVALLSRNLGVLLTAGVAVPTALRILAGLMATIGRGAIWAHVVESVRQGSKLSQVLVETEALPMMAIRMLRLGEETGQLPLLSGRIAEFYETKLERSLDRLVGIIGPLAIVTISIIVGGLIVSVMTSLLSVSQLVG